MLDRLHDQSDQVLCTFCMAGAEQFIGEKEDVFVFLKTLAEMILFGELAEQGGNVAVSVKKENGKAVGLKLEVFEDQTAEPA